MRVVVTEVGWDGSIRRRAVETVALPDAGRWEYLRAGLPARYRALADVSPR